MNHKKLKETLEAHAKDGMGCGVGFPESWTPIISKLHKELIKIDENYIIDQVKEKFGGLRFYIQDYKEGMSDIITKHEQETRLICCECGETATKKSKGWAVFYCDKHAPEGSLEK